MTMVQGADAQSKRAQRAFQQADRYTVRFSWAKVTDNATGRTRRVRIAYVEAKDGSSSYVVTMHNQRPRCSCPDFAKRCAGTLLKCKHCILVETFPAAFERDETPDEQAARLAAVRQLWD